MPRSASLHPAPVEQSSARVLGVGRARPWCSMTSWLYCTSTMPGLTGVMLRHSVWSHLGSAEGGSIWRWTSRMEWRTCTSRPPRWSSTLTSSPRTACSRRALDGPRLLMPVGSLTLWTSVHDVRLPGCGYACTLPAALPHLICLWPAVLLWLSNTSRACTRDAQNSQKLQH